MSVRNRYFQNAFLFKCDRIKIRTNSSSEPLHAVTADAFSGWQIEDTGKITLPVSQSLGTPASGVPALRGR